MLKKMTIQSWAMVVMVAAIIVLFLIIFLRKPVDPNAELNKQVITKLQNEIVDLNKRVDEQHSTNEKDKIELLTYYETEIGRLNKNIQKLYKKLDETLDTIHNLNGDDSFNFFSSWVPKEN